MLSNREKQFFGKTHPTKILEPIQNNIKHTS